MKQIPKKIREVDSKFRSLSSLIQSEYEELLSVFSKECEKKLSLYTLKGVRRKYPKYTEHKTSSLYGSVSKLDFLLLYLKEDCIQSRQGLLFEISQSKVSEWLSFLLPVLESSLDKLNYLPQKGFSFDSSQSTDLEFVGND